MPTVEEMLVAADELEGLGHTAVAGWLRIRADAITCRVCRDTGRRGADPHRVFDGYPCRACERGDDLTFLVDGGYYSGWQLKIYP